MRVLFVCHRYPFPPKRGGKIRPFNIIKHFQESGHAVHVASLVRSTEEQLEGVGLEKYCASAFHAKVTRSVQGLRMIGRLFSTTPSSMGFFYSRKLDHYIQALLNKHSFDLIFVHCSSVAQYVKDVKGPLKHLDFGDMDSQKWLEYSQYKPFPLSMGYLIEGKKLVSAERNLSKIFDQCSATTRGELETLVELNPSVRGRWFPNGVDASFFRPVQTYDENLISFVGRMDYFPNQEGVTRFVKDVFPLIKKAKPQSKFVVVGAQPTDAIRSLEAVDGVTVTGTVADVRPFITNSVLNVAPLAIARGTQNKILEAMAMGVPVVTSGPAAKGVDALGGVHFEVADEARETADKILSIMQNPARRMQLASAGRERVLSHHAWPASMERLDGIVRDLLAEHTAR